MSILHALSTIPFFVNINQGIDRTLALLEVKEKNATLKGQPVLIDCINLMLCSLTVLENELTAIAAATDTAIAAATDTAAAAATDTAAAAATDTAAAAATDTAIAAATDTAAAAATDTAIAAATDTAIVSESTTVIDDDFQLVTFEEMTDYLFFQQSWKMIKDPSLAMKEQGYLSDRIDSTAWSFNKVLPIYYDKENKMIIVKSGLNFYGCIGSHSSIDDLKWQFAHNLLHDLKHCNAAATDTAIAAATDTAAAAATDTAAAAATDTAIAAKSTTAIAAATDTAIAAATDTAIAAKSTTAIAAATDTAITAATDTAITAATDTAIAAVTVKTETEANRALSKFQKLWYLEQIHYPVEQLKGIASINAAITSVSSFMAAYKAVKNHGIPEKDPNKKSAKSNKQTVVATANTSDMESIPLGGSNGVSPELKEFCDLKDRGIVSTTREYNELKLQEQSQNMIVASIDFNGCNIINSPQLQTEKAEILSVNGIKVGGTIEIKKP